MYFSSFFFKENRASNEEDSPLQKVVIVQEELDDIDMDDIGALENLPRLVLIDEACVNPKVVD